MRQRYAYSYDRQDFTGDYASPEEAFAEGQKRAEGLSSPPTEIYIGTLVEADPQATDHAQAIVEAMNRRAHVDYGDPAARYMRNVPPEQVRELDAAIAATILQWLQKHRLAPTFVKVQSIREYPVPLTGPTGVYRSSASGTISVADQPVDSVGT